MKVIITENKYKEVAKSMLIDTGTKSTIEFLGGLDNFCLVFNIESPMDFLHLFDNLDVVQSKKSEDFILFRYNPKENFMVYDKKNKEVFIDYDEIWSFLRSNFGLNYQEIQGLTGKWLDEVYNLKGVTTNYVLPLDTWKLDEVYNLIHSSQYLYYMKLIITENQKDKMLKSLVKHHGFKMVGKMVGTDYLVNNVFNGDPNEFLSLYDDLERVESEENPNVFLYRYKKGKNVMVFDERDYEKGNVYVYINHDIIFGPLALFKSSEIYSDTVRILSRWFKNNFGIENYIAMIDSFHPKSEEYGFYELLT